MDFFIEDNEECFCGSKKTFKLCCKKNIRDKEISFKEEILQFTNNPDRLSYIIWEKIESCKTEKCNYPGCDKKAINSHALQRNRILSRLTNDNHVLVFDPKEFNKSLGYLIAKLKGEEINHQCKFDFLNEVSIKKATTFEGFCNKHDTELFLPIEKYNYDRKDRKQNFLFAYRIVNQEYCDKQTLLNLFQNIFRERPILSTDFIFVENYRMRMLEVQDIEKLKRIFDNALIQNNYDLIKTHTIELK